MALASGDRFHAKQGRETARFLFQAASQVMSRPHATGSTSTASRPAPTVAVYLKRHFRLPWTARLAALVHPGGRHSPAAAEWAHLERARALGIAVPDVVAAGERIGPRSRLFSFLMVAELTGSEPINELLPEVAARLDPREFAALKRRVISEMVRITATLHNAHAFHKDLYLCHFFLNLAWIERRDGPPPVALIDLHRLGEHRVLCDWWRWKDLGQLLFSTFGVTGIKIGDRLRFWALYRRLTGLRRPWWHLCVIRFRAGRYLAHNRKRRQTSSTPAAESLQGRCACER
jgi:heptose I phosphotransferase